MYGAVHAVMYRRSKSYLFHKIPWKNSLMQSGSTRLQVIDLKLLCIGQLKRMFSMERFEAFRMATFLANVPIHTLSKHQKIKGV